MKTVQTVEIIFANTKGNFQEILKKVSVKLASLNVEDHFFLFKAFLQVYINCVTMLFNSSTINISGKCR